MAGDEKDLHRTGGQTDEPHGTMGPPSDRNPDAPRKDKPGTAQDAGNATKPTNPIEGTTVRSGKP